VAGNLATLSEPRSAATPRGAHEWTGTLTLLRLVWRRDRWSLVAWTLGLAAMAGFSAAATVGLYPDAASRSLAAAAVNNNAATLAMFGPVYDPDSLGELAMFKMTVFGGIALAVVLSLLVIRHTRAEEESGRAELLAAGVVGRAASLSAVMLAAIITAVAVGALTAGALVAAGLPGVGSIAFGAAWAATGVAFAAVAAVAAQLSSTARGAREIALVAVGLAYALRAVGDATDPGASPWSWLSPLGWNKEVRAFAGDRWVVLLLPLLVTAVLVPVAFWLRSRRDLGRGLWAADQRLAPVLRVRGLPSLVLRLNAGPWLVWCAFFVAFAAVMGTVSASMEEWITSPQMRDLITALGGQESVTDATLAAYLIFLAMTAAAFAISTTLRMRTDEVAGHAEVLLASGATRRQWALAFLVVPVLGSAVLLALGAATMGITSAVALAEPDQFFRVLLAGLAQIPVVWVMAMLAFATVGWLPRFTAVVWLVFLASAAIAEFGALWSLPQWLVSTSVFHAAPMLPISGEDLPTIVGLLGIAAILGALGFAGWQHRDVGP